MQDYNFLSAWLSIWIACLWVAIWQAFLIFKTMDTIWKNPSLSKFFLTITILWIALLESASIYSLLIAFQVLNASFSDSLASIWVGLSIWLTGFWAWVWEWILISKTIDAINLNPDFRNKIMAFMILFVALIESSAIYWFIISIQILQNENISWFLAIWASLAIWLVWIWVPIWEWILASKSILTIWEDEENARNIVPFTILWIALIESAAIYWLIIAWQILSKDNSLWISAIWAWLAIWLAWFWTALWEANVLGKASSSLVDRYEKTKAIITTSILWVALVESAAIYWLLIAYKIIEGNFWWASIWAGLAIWFAWFWVAIWEWFLVWKAMFTIWINRVNISRIMTFMILFIALVESAAIYWFIISYTILSSTDMWFYSSLWAWLAIWLAGCWVWIWEWILTSRSIFIIWKRPRFASFFLTITILWVALVESAAIYWLLVSWQITNEIKESLLPIWAWLAIWLTGLAAGFSEWYLVSGSFKAMARNPEGRIKDLTYMILFVALVEVLAIYWLFIAFNILGK